MRARGQDGEDPILLRTARGCSLSGITEPELFACPLSWHGVRRCVGVTLTAPGEERSIEILAEALAPDLQLVCFHCDDVGN